MTVRKSGFVFSLLAGFVTPAFGQDGSGDEEWSIGPSFVAFTVKGPWVVGALLNNIWSVAGEDDRAHPHRQMGSHERREMDNSLRGLARCLPSDASP